MPTEQTIDRALFEIEANRWGGADYCTGGTEAACPYSDDAPLAEIWLKSFRIRRANATIVERFVAATARILRFKLF
jgi:hypothetical protein